MDGEADPMDGKADPMDGEADGTVSVVHEASANGEAAQVPHDYPTDLIDMLGYAPAMIYTFTVDENNENPRFPFVSRGAMNVYGVSCDAIMADPNALIGAIMAEDLASFVESVRDSWEHLTEWMWTGRFIDKDGYRWVKCNSIPKRLPNNHTIWYGVTFDIDAQKRLADSESSLKLSVAAKKVLQDENEAMGLKYAHAFDLLNDVVFSVRATSWETNDWHVYECSKSFADYFPTGLEKPFLETVDDATGLAELLNAARESTQPIRDLSVFRPEHSSDTRTLRCRAVDLSSIEGFTSVLVVCHDLTDFKFRIEAEKDRQVGRRRGAAPRLGLTAAVALTSATASTPNSCRVLFASRSKLWFQVLASRRHVITPCPSPCRRHVLAPHPPLPKSLRWLPSCSMRTRTCTNRSKWAPTTRSSSWRSSRRSWQRTATRPHSWRARSLGRCGWIWKRCVTSHPRRCGRRRR